MSNHKRLSERVAIVTGSAGGIGETTAKTLAREGASVVIADINLQEAKRVASEIEELGEKSLAVQVDVTRLQEVVEMVGTVLERWGAIDILVNNAGGFDKFSSILEITEDEWDQVVALNLKSVFLCCQAVAKNRMERRKGRIINIASRTGLAPNPGGPDYLPYGAGKTGVLGFTRLLTKTLGPYGITVNAVSPSTALTARIKRIRDPQSLKKIAEMAPLGHLVEPQDCAEAILFLASEEARYITGINLNVNAGILMI